MNALEFRDDGGFRHELASSMHDVNHQFYIITTLFPKYRGLRSVIVPIGALTDNNMTLTTFNELLLKHHRLKFHITPTVSLEVYSSQLKDHCFSNTEFDYFIQTIKQHRSPNTRAYTESYGDTDITPIIKEVVDPDKLDNKLFKTSLIKLNQDG